MRIKKNAVIVPTHVSHLKNFEKKSLENNIAILKNHDIYFVAPNRLSNNSKFSELTKNYNLKVEFFNDKYFNDNAGYNKLLITKSFYERFLNYDFMLICQLDVIVFSDELDNWINKKYDYIGAPWFSNHNGKLKIDSSGNGGFSLRNIKKSIEVLTSKKLYFNLEKFSNTSLRVGLKYLLLIKLLNKSYFRFLNPVKIVTFLYSGTEDYFWVFLAKFFVKDFVLPEPEVALKFSFEMYPKHCFELNNQNLPFGCHAWQKYDRAFWEIRMPYLKE